MRAKGCCRPLNERKICTGRDLRCRERIYAFPTGGFSENARAGHECPAYRISENAGFPCIKYGAGSVKPGMASTLFSIRLLNLCSIDGAVFLFRKGGNKLDVTRLLVTGNSAPHKIDQFLLC